MTQQRRDLRAGLRALLRRWTDGRMPVLLLPTLALAAYWSAGEAALIAVAFGIPLIGLAALIQQSLRITERHGESPTGLPGGNALVETLGSTCDGMCTDGRKTACILVGLDAIARVTERHGQATTDAMLDLMATRLRSALREDDCLCWIGDDTFAIGLHAMVDLDLESALQLTARLQHAVEEPAVIDGQTIYLAAAAGLCLSSRAPAKSGIALFEGARSALAEARQNGPSAIRVYSPEMGRLHASQAVRRDEALRALENGEITPWFQPQISTDTGHVTGFEALARWNHPRRGIVPPAEFLPILAQAGQMERLGETMLYGALKALTLWDAEGLDVPCVAVNFSGEELQNPRLADKVRWDLDRFDLSPDRLTVEVLETVVVGAARDAATQNILRFAAMGCRIDLDDFGTGHASISAIRRFSIERIKIDRSFVTGVDEDPDQQRMVSAILTMAERLGLETLGEGVETAGEHAMLAQLGCDHVQGFGIARPMPFKETSGWIPAHEASLAPLPRIGRSAT